MLHSDFSVFMCVSLECRSNMADVLHFITQGIYTTHTDRCFQVINSQVGSPS